MNKLEESEKLKRGTYPTLLTKRMYCEDTGKKEYVLFFKQLKILPSAYINISHIYGK
jgi:hypothetical protein